MAATKEQSVYIFIGHQDGVGDGDAAACCTHGQFRAP